MMRAWLLTALLERMLELVSHDGEELVLQVLVLCDSASFLLCSLCRPVGGKVAGDLHKAAQGAALEPRPAVDG